MDIRSTFGSPGHGPRDMRNGKEISQFSARNWRLGPLVIILLATLATSSCIDLSLVTQFANSSQAVGSNFKTLADDAKATCESAVYFFPPGKTPERCDLYVKVEPEFIKVNDVLFSYISSLGKLAAGASPQAPAGGQGTSGGGQATSGDSQGTGLSSIGTTIQKYDSNFTSAQVKQANAAGGLFDALSKILLSGYQEHALARIIRENDSTVQDTSNFLSEYAGGELRTIVFNTGILEEQYCTHHQKFPDLNEPLAEKLVARRCDEDAVRLKAELAAVEKYQTALKTIGKTHATLAADKNEWSAKELLKVIGPQISAMNAAATAMQNAFK